MFEKYFVERLNTSSIIKFRPSSQIYRNGIPLYQRGVPFPFFSFGTGRGVSHTAFVRDVCPARHCLVGR